VSKIALLQCNLREIYAASQRYDKKPLVPNLFGTRLYSKNFLGWGRLWKWFFDLLEIFGNTSFKEKKIKQALRLTHTIFFQELDRASKSAKRYENYLKGESKGSISPERRVLFKWEKATKTFLHAFKKETFSKLNAIVYSELPKDPLKNPFSSPEQEILVNKMCAVVALEGYFRERLPLEVLKKVALKSPLSFWENKTFSRFSKKIEKTAAKKRRYCLFSS